MAKFCGNCGAAMADDAAVCGNCGTAFVEEAAPAAKVKVGNFSLDKKFLPAIGAAAVALILVVVLLISLIFGGGYKKAIDNYLAVNFEGKVSKIDDLAPKAYWEWYEDENDESIKDIKEEFEEMNLFEIREHIQNLELKGADNTLPYRIEMHKRIASPAAIIILTIIGAALSSRKVRGGMGLHLGIGIVITFSYILFMEFSRVFALSGVFSPFIAAWLPNIIFSIIGIYFLVKAPK
jgi:hypothetical protein